MMRRIVILCLMAIATTSAFAQLKVMTDTTNIRLTEVEISASRTAATLGKTGRVVAVITKEQLQGMNIQSVSDAIDYIAGVDMRQRGPEGIQNDVSIRGGSFDQVLVMLNGVNMTDPQTGHLSMNLPVDLSAVERIEVLEGPGARAYGPNAFSGAINFVTGTQNNNQLAASAQGGSFGFAKGTINGTIKSGKLTSFAGVNYSRSDGHHENTDFDQYGLFYQGRLDYGSENLEFQMGYLDKSYGAFAFYTPVLPNQYEQNRTINSSLKFSTQGNLVKITPIVYWRRNHDRFELVRGNPTTYNYYYHMTDVYGSSLNANVKWAAGVTAIGADIRAENIWSNNIGNLMAEPIEVPGEDGKQFTKSYSRQNTMLFLEHTYSHNALTVTAGAIANRNSGYDFNTSFYPGIDVSYVLPNAMRFYAGVNTSLRMPTFTDLFYNNPTAQGTINLKPEEMTAYETGVKYYTAQWQAHLGGFIHQGYNLIDWVRESGTASKYVATNVANMTTMGVQTTVGYTPERGDALAVVVRSLSADYMYLTQDKEAQPGIDSRYVMDYLRHKLVLRLEHNIYKYITASWSYRYQDRMGWYTNAIATKQNYTPIGLVDLQVTYAKPNYSVFAGATNLFDIDYEDIGNVPQPGRWIRGGMAVKLNW